MARPRGRSADRRGRLSWGKFRSSFQRLCTILRSGTFSHPAATKARLMSEPRFNVLHNSDEFADRVGDFLVVHEAEHSLLFGILSNLSSGWAYGTDSGGVPVLALVEDDAGIAVVGVCTPPRNLVISRA